MKYASSALFNDSHLRRDALAAIRDVEFIEMSARTILNRARTRGYVSMDDQSVPRMRVGCVYCYTRYTHEFLELRDPMDFERRIFVKRMAAQVLSHTLSRTPSARTRLRSARDHPYQPAERKYGLTRSMLEVFAQLAGSIFRSPPIGAGSTRSRPALRDQFALEDKRQLLADDAQPPPPAHIEAARAASQLRLRALAELSRAVIRCNLLMMPVIPGLTDAPAAIESVVRAARRAGASAVWWRSLFLKPSAARRFIPFIKEHFPEVAGRSMSSTPARSMRRGYDERIGAVFDRMARSTVLRWIIGTCAACPRRRARDRAGHAARARGALEADAPPGNFGQRFRRFWLELAKLDRRLVRGAGLEPARYFYHEPLKLACLPFHHPRTHWPRLARGSQITN